MTPSQLCFLAGVLPGDGQWPCAADLNLDEASIGASASMLRAWEHISEWQLPAREHPEALAEALTTFERTHPDDFAQGLVMAYGMYYAHPNVLKVVEHRSGYAARPPQPQGHVVVSADTEEHPMTNPAKVLWRNDGTNRSEEIQMIQQTHPDRVWTVEEIATWPMS